MHCHSEASAYAVDALAEIVSDPACHISQTNSAQLHLRATNHHNYALNLHMLADAGGGILFEGNPKVTKILIVPKRDSSTRGSNSMSIDLLPATSAKQSGIYIHLTSELTRPSHRADGLFPLPSQGLNVNVN